jgi:hypothetical protein
MKKLYLSASLLICFFVSFAQYPNGTQFIGTDSNVVRTRGGSQGRFININYADTTAANLDRIRQYPGAQIYTTSDSSFWIRNPSATAWKTTAKRFGLEDNIMASNRAVNMGGFNMATTNGNWGFNSSNPTRRITIGDNTVGQNTLFLYAPDGSSSFIESASGASIGISAGSFINLRPNIYSPDAGQIVIFPTPAGYVSQSFYSGPQIRLGETGVNVLDPIDSVFEYFIRPLDHPSPGQTTELTLYGPKRILETEQISDSTGYDIAVINRNNGKLRMMRPNLIGGGDEIDLIGIFDDSNGQGWGSSTLSPPIIPGVAFQYYDNALTAKTADPIGNANTGSSWPAFANTWYTLTGRKICFVPMGIPGSTMNASADVGNGNWDTTGTLFDTAIARTQRAITVLTAAGYSVNFKGILTGLGGNDALAINATTINQAAYITSFTRFRARIRSIFGPKTPIYIHQLGKQVTGTDAGHALVRAAQVLATNADSLTNIVFWNTQYFITRGLQTDQYHYTQSGYNEMGRIMAEQILNSGGNKFQEQDNNIWFSKGNVGIGITKGIPMYQLDVSDSIRVSGLSISRRGYAGAPSINTVEYLTVKAGQDLLIQQSTAGRPAEYRFAQNDEGTSGNGTTPYVGVINGFNYGAGGVPDRRRDLFITTSGSGTTPVAGNIRLKPGTKYWNLDTTQFVKDSVIVELNSGATFSVLGGKTYLTDTLATPNIQTKDVDTTNFKLDVVDASGNHFKMNWAYAGSGGGGGSAAWNDITNPTGSQTLSFDDGELNDWTTSSNTETFHTYTANSLTSGTGISMSLNGLTSGSGISITSTSTAKTGANTLLNLNSSGANAASSIINRGATVSVTNTGTTSENRALELTASGATTNWAAYATAGNFRTVGAAGYYALNSAGTGGVSMSYDNSTIGTIGTTGGIRLDLEAASSTILARRPFIVGMGIDFGNNVSIDAYKSASGTSNIQNWRSSGGGVLASVNQSGRFFIGGSTSATALIHLAAGTTAASTAPFKLTTGPVNTTPEQGALEYTTPQLTFVNGGAIRQELFQGQQSRVSTQFDKTNTTLDNITGLTANVAAGKIYRFEAILYTTSDVAGGVKVAIGGTATATSIIYEGLTTDGGLTTQSRTTTLGNAVGAVTAVTAACIKVTGTITVNVAGTLTCQFAENAATATSSVLVGSTFVVIEML